MPKNHFNILWIMTDQHNANCMRCAGNSDVKTPVLDALAASSVRFTNAFAQSGICTPSRICYTTGMYVHQHGQYCNWGNVADHITLPGWLAEFGYQTFASGKLHYLPYMKHGFQKVAPTCWCDTMDDPMENAHWAYLVSKGKQDYADISGKYRGTGTKFMSWISPYDSIDSIEATTTREMIRFLENRDRDKPFLGFLSFDRPHQPYSPPLDYADMYDPEKITLPVEADVWESKPASHVAWRNQKQGAFSHGLLGEREKRILLSRYYALITLIDKQIGEVLGWIHGDGIEQETLVIYCSDHGDFACEHGLMEKALRGYDSILRVPFIVKLPGVIAANETRDQIVEVSGLFATICEMIGIPTPESVKVPSFSAEIQNDNAAGRDVIFSETIATRTMRTREWKYVELGDDRERELYDLRWDPGETLNLAERPRHRARVMEMREALRQWDCDTGGRGEFETQWNGAYDPDHPDTEGYRILTGEWWPAEKRKATFE